MHLNLIWLAHVHFAAKLGSVGYVEQEWCGLSWGMLSQEIFIVFQNLETKSPFKLSSPRYLAFCGRLCLSYLYTKWHGCSYEGLVHNGPNSHSGPSLTTGVLLQCKFCPVVIISVPIITSVTDALVHGTNTLSVYYYTRIIVHGMYT